MLGKFLEFLVTNQRIESNPEKIKAILNMKYHSIKKEV